MKKITFTAITILASGLIFTSCSKCYECTTEHEVESIVGTDTLTTLETSTEDYCTADDGEIEQLEKDQGATCIAI